MNRLTYLYIRLWAEWKAYRLLRWQLKRNRKRARGGPPSHPPPAGDSHHQYHTSSEI